MNKRFYAEDVNYWKTGQRGSDAWIDGAKDEIKAVGGKIVRNAYEENEKFGGAAFLVEFELGGELFKVIFPVLESKKKEERAARVQAATALYHSVKAQCVMAKFVGARAAFLPYLTLPDGRSASEAASADIAALYPRVLLLSDGSR